MIRNHALDRFTEAVFFQASRQWLWELVEAMKIRDPGRLTMEANEGVMARNIIRSDREDPDYDQLFVDSSEFIHVK